MRCRALSGVNTESDLQSERTKKVIPNVERGRGEIPNNQKRDARMEAWPELMKLYLNSDMF